MRKGWQGQQGRGHSAAWWEQGGHSCEASEAAAVVPPSPWDAPPKAGETRAAWGSTGHSPAQEPSGDPQGSAPKFKRSWLLAPERKHSHWPPPAFPPLLQLHQPQPTHLLCSLPKTSFPSSTSDSCLVSPPRKRPPLHPKQVKHHPSLSSGRESLVSPMAS